MVVKKALAILLVIFTSIVSGMDIGNIENYRIYYGRIEERHIEAFKEYDLVIVEGKFLTKEMVSELQENNTLVIAYLSVMEIGAWDVEFRSRLAWTDYIKNFIFYKKDDKNYLGNPYRSHYRKQLLHLIEERGLSKGVDGVFLDTVDWIDVYRDKKRFYRKLIYGYTKLLKELNSKNKDIIIIQNRGFHVLESLELELIDAVLWENYNINSSRYDRREKILKDVNQNGIKILTLHFKDNKENRKKALKNGWIPLFQETRFSKWEDR